MTVGKIIKVVLSAALKPTATRDLEPRSMLCLRRTFPKVARPFKERRSEWSIAFFEERGRAVFESGSVFRRGREGLKRPLREERVA